MTALDNSIVILVPFRDWYLFLGSFLQIVYLKYSATKQVETNMFLGCFLQNVYLKYSATKQVATNMVSSAVYVGGYSIELDKAVTERFAILQTSLVSFRVY